MTRRGCVALWLCAPALMQAHGLAVEWEPAAGAVVLTCRYTSGDPADAEVLVYSPEDAEGIYQRLRTDVRGVAAFVPDAPGQWLVVVDDGLGHREAVDVPVGEAGPAPPETDGDRPLTYRLVAAAALALGLLAWFARRRSQPE